jgi:hypothetical protein
LDRRELDPLHAPQDGAWEDWTRIVLPVLGG